MTEILRLASAAMFALAVVSPARAQIAYDPPRPLDGIAVVIMQPEAMAMDRPALGAHLRTVENAGSDSPSHRMVARMARDTAASKLTPETVAEKIHAVITSEKPPLRVPMDRAKGVTLLRRLAPQSVIDRVIGGLRRDSAPGSDG